ncbi:hypothetical protein Mapa_015255 [Marchantia paleacea]|nr:hypothetical protein Mapa_015255 [Marchantia paleacea]
MPGVSVCQMCSVNVFAVIPMQTGGPVNLGRKSHRILVQFSALSTSSDFPGQGHRLILGQPVCSTRVALHSMGLSSTQGKLMGPINIYGLAEQMSSIGCRIPFKYLSKGGNLPTRRPLTRLQCKPVARISDSNVGISEGKNVSVTGRDIPPDSRETTIRESNSASVSPSGALSQRGLPLNLATGVGVTAAVFMMAMLGFLAKPRRNGGGSMADLIRRGQVRSDRGADSELLNYEDPFNNPLVKMGTKNPIVRMCGKIFRLAPVTLTDEKVAKHQNRRIQAYKWKRPIVFLNDGDPVPEGVDPEEVRWIPSNHPFATTSNYIDEDLAQKNVYQTRGVPSRVRAEHDALRKKMEETAKRGQDFQPPNMEFGGEQAWKTSNFSADETSERIPNEGKATDTTASFDKQINGKSGGSSSSINGQSQGGGSFSGEPGSRFRTIDFSGEVQGSGGRDQQRYNNGGLDS